MKGTAIDSSTEGRYRRSDRDAGGPAMTAREGRSTTFDVTHAIGVMGHELRNPLSSIVAATASLLDGPNVTDGERRRLAIIERSTRRMADIIERALDYVEIGGTRRLRLSRQSVDLHAVCEEVVAELLIRNPRAAVHLHMSGHGVGHWDRLRVAQIVSNLIANAFVHGSTGTPIFVSLSRVNDDAVLEVRNRGPVIAPDVLPTLFEPFRRGADAAPPVPGRRSGLGLGLHIVKQIAEAHGGTIDARSAAEEGTVFVVTLPTRHPRSDGDEWGHSECLDPDDVGDIADEGAGHRG
jgi:signal transduction histidine kinase